MITLQKAVHTLAVALEQQLACSPEEARREARLVVGEALGFDSLAFFKNLDTSLQGFPEFSLKRLAAFQERRLKGEPLSRIRGTRSFWKDTFYLSTATLDPRPETEGLIDLALTFFQGNPPPKTIVDVGTGTGCLLLSLLQEFPQALGLGIDCSRDALEVAQKNRALLNQREQCSFVEANWMEGLEGPFDLIVSNPPYIPSGEIEDLAPEVRCFDPLLAFDGGKDGFEAYRHIIPQAAKCLSRKGVFLFEMGQGQERFLRTLLADSFKRTHFSRDLRGIVRYGMGGEPY